MGSRGSRVQKLDAMQEARVQGSQYSGIQGMQETRGFRKLPDFSELHSRDSGNGDAGNHAIQEAENTRFRKPRDSPTSEPKLNPKTKAWAPYCRKMPETLLDFVSTRMLRPIGSYRKDGLRNAGHRCHFVKLRHYEMRAKALCESPVPPWLLNFPGRIPSIMRIPDGP